MIKFVDKHIELEDLPKSFKKMTATRFASVLGLNEWSTPFEMWCEITRTYEKPFEDTVYTIAGKAIEPKVIEYLKKRYRLDIQAPAEVYGKDYFKQTRGDFFKDFKVFGGMWDAIDKHAEFVVEIKTTKRAEDWIDGIPIYYKLQAGLYAYLLNIDQVYVTCSFLKESDYTNPETFEPAVENTIIRDFKMSEDFPDFKERYIIPALNWWEQYVETGISPDYDEKRDADIIKVLRTANVEIDDASVATLVDDIEQKQKQLDAIKVESDKIEKALKKSKEALKKYLMDKFTDQSDKVELVGETYKFTVSKTSKSDVDKKALESDGLLDKYQITKTEYRFNVKRKEEQK